MKNIIRRHYKSFDNAWSGLSWSMSTQPNYKVHLLMAILAFLGGTIFKISHGEWLVILMLIMVGLVVETINTAIEATLNAVDRTIRDDIRIAKDVSAAAMLIFALGALIIAAVIFIPHIWLSIFLRP